MMALPSSESVESVRSTSPTSACSKFHSEYFVAALKGP
jgi:hypothetical protein